VKGHHGFALVNKICRPLAADNLTKDAVGFH
jgi:hypothetical protein